MGIVEIALLIGLVTAPVAGVLLVVRRLGPALARRRTREPGRDESAGPADP